MPDSTVKLYVASSEDSGLVLSAEEIKHIRNCRMLKPEACAMVFDLATLYTRTLPAQRPALTLARPAD
jgi:hypothetical protein